MEDFQLDLIIGEGPARALDAHRPAALHPGRRDDPLRADHPAAARAFRHPAAPAVLRAGRAGADRRPRRPRARLRPAPRRRRRDRPPRPRHAARRDAPAAPHPRFRRGAGLGRGRRRAPPTRRCCGSMSTRRGLDGMDRRYLRCIAENYGGGPVGVETMAAALGDQRDVHRGGHRALPDAGGLRAAHPARPHADRDRLPPPRPAGAGEPARPARPARRRRGS